MLDRLGIKSEFREGLRVTDEATVEVVEMVLAVLRGGAVAHGVAAILDDDHLLVVALHVRQRLHQECVETRAVPAACRGRTLPRPRARLPRRGPT
jgi:uncharacterized protein YqeY